jgi:hypothetical protein
VAFNPSDAQHAALRQTKRYWDEKRGGRSMASRKDIRPGDLKPWLPQILLVDVLPDARDFRYRLIGTKLRPYFPNEATGLSFSEALAPFGEATVAATLSVYRSVVAKRAPALVSGPGKYYAQESKFFEAMLMPLSDDDSIVTMIFGAFEFDWAKAKMPPAAG